VSPLDLAGHSGQAELPRPRAGHLVGRREHEVLASFGIRAGRFRPVVRRLLPIGRCSRAVVRRLCSIGGRARTIALGSQQDVLIRRIIRQNVGAGSDVAPFRVAIARFGKSVAILGGSHSSVRGLFACAGYRIPVLLGAGSSRRRALVRGRVAARREVFVRSLLVLVCASLIAIAPGLIVIGPGLVLIAQGLITIAERSLAVGDGR
jgi:hypothetical protein